MKRGDEVTLRRPGHEPELVVVVEVAPKTAYIEHENGDCEWVDRAWLTEEDVCK